MPSTADRKKKKRAREPSPSETGKRYKHDEKGKKRQREASNAEREAKEPRTRGVTPAPQRIRLHFGNGCVPKEEPDLVKRWLIVPANLKTVSDLHRYLQAHIKSLGKERRLVLSVSRFALPPSEALAVVRDGDMVHVEAAAVAAATGSGSRNGGGDGSNSDSSSSSRDSDGSDDSRAADKGSGIIRGSSGGGDGGTIKGPTAPAAEQRHMNGAGKTATKPAAKKEGNVHSRSVAAAAAAVPSTEAKPSACQISGPAATEEQPPAPAASGRRAGKGTHITFGDDSDQELQPQLRQPPPQPEGPRAAEAAAAATAEASENVSQGRRRGRRGGSNRAKRANVGHSVGGYSGDSGGDGGDNGVAVGGAASLNGAARKREEANAAAADAATAVADAAATPPGAAASATLRAFDRWKRPYSVIASIHTKGKTGARVANSSGDGGGHEESGAGAAASADCLPPWPADLQPQPGDILAFRHLRLSEETWTPELGPYERAEVVAFAGDEVVFADATAPPGPDGGVAAAPPEEAGSGPEAGPAEEETAGTTSFIWSELAAVRFVSGPSVEKIAKRSEALNRWQNLH